MSTVKKGLALRLSTAKTIFADVNFLLYGVFGALLIAIPIIVLTNYPLIYGNYGPAYYYTTIAIQFLIVMLFGLNISGFTWRLFQSIHTRKRATASTSISSFLVLLVTGCSSCGISLASYLGLATFFSSFPFAGLELKVLSVILLLYSNYVIYTPIVCKIPKK